MFGGQGSFGVQVQDSKRLGSRLGLFRALQCRYKAIGQRLKFAGLGVRGLGVLALLAASVGLKV